MWIRSPINNATPVGLTFKTLALMEKDYVEVKQADEEKSDRSRADKIIAAIVETMKK